MTECERIVKSGRIREEFFVPEYRCDFFVDETRKKIWAIEIDLYLEIEKICKRHNLRFFIIFGSLLGCIRHEGFIPWDDDFDIAMPREDYDKLMLLTYEFQPPYFLQLPMTDINSGFSVAKLRNSNTSAIAAPFRYQKMNHGIFVDIVPIDKVDMGYVQENYEKVKWLALQNSTFMRMTNPKPNERDMERIKNWKGLKSDEVYNMIHKICSQYRDTEQEYVGITSATIYKYTKQIFKSKDFDDIIWKKFEDITVPVPKGYDDILKVLYGEYMQFPPLDERGMAHNSIFFEPDVPFENINGGNCFED